MKILIVTEHYWPEVGAASSRLANMAEGFKREGHEVDVLTTLPNYPEGHILPDTKEGCGNASSTMTSLCSVIGYMPL